MPYESIYGESFWAPGDDSGSCMEEDSVRSRTRRVREIDIANAYDRANYRDSWGNVTPEAQRRIERRERERRE